MPQLQCRIAISAKIAIADLDRQGRLLRRPRVVRQRRGAILGWSSPLNPDYWLGCRSRIRCLHLNKIFSPAPIPPCSVQELPVKTQETYLPGRFCGAFWGVPSGGTTGRGDSLRSTLSCCFVSARFGARRLAGSPGSTFAGGCAASVGRPEGWGFAAGGLATCGWRC